VRLSGSHEALVERDELLVPTERAGQGGGVDAFSQAGSPACDVTFADALAAVVRERSQPCQRSLQPWTAISSFALATSIPAAIVVVLLIFVDPSL
jgi:hypothetical protein